MFVNIGPIMGHVGMLPGLKKRRNSCYWVIFLFDGNRNLCNYAGVYVRLCMCVYACDVYLVDRISQERTLGKIAHVVCSCNMLIT